MGRRCHVTLDTPTGGKLLTLGKSLARPSAGRRQRCAGLLPQARGPSTASRPASSERCLRSSFAATMIDLPHSTALRSSHSYSIRTMTVFATREVLSHYSTPHRRNRVRHLRSTLTVTRPCASLSLLRQTSTDTSPGASLAGMGRMSSCRGVLVTVPHRPVYSSCTSPHRVCVNYKRHLTPRPEVLGGRHI